MHYLVMLRHSMDEIPVYLTSSKSEALDFANNLRPDGDHKEQEIIGIDATTPTCVAIYKFSESGKLVDFENVKNFDGSSVI